MMSKLGWLNGKKNNFHILSSVVNYSTANFCLQTTGRQKPPTSDETVLETYSRNKTSQKSLVIVMSSKFNRQLSYLYAPYLADYLTSIHDSLTGVQSMISQQTRETSLFPISNYFCTYTQDSKKGEREGI